MGSTHWGGVAAIAALYVVFLVVGWRGSRKLKLGTPAELLVANRAMPLWMATLTMAATWIDGGYLLGTAEGVFTNLPTGWQGGVCFGISLLVGGTVFAGRMRQLEFVTLVDPLAARFGKPWAAVLSLPAIFGEIFWSAELLVAVGASLGVILGVDLPSAIVIAAAIVTFYTVLGGMWSLGYADSVQFMLIPIGLGVALPFAMSAIGGFDSGWKYYAERQGQAASLFPPLTTNDYWSAPQLLGWWDLSIMLIFGGIPWNCYFQRVQSCETPAKARWHSIFAGIITIVMTIPPLLLGIAAFAYQDWSPDARAELAHAPTLALPLLFAQALPAWVAVVGLTAIVGAVTSSFSASILSVGSMIGWNVYRGLISPDVSAKVLLRVIRVSILAFGVVAMVLSLRVQSVQQLWFFTSDLVFVLLFPQLLYSLFDPRANRTGSIVALVVSLVLRLGGGEPIFGLPAWIPYAQIFGGVLPGGREIWLDSAGHANLFPIRTLAAAAGLVLLPTVSRLTARWDAPRPLPNPSNDGRA